MGTFSPQGKLGQIQDPRGGGRSLMLMETTTNKTCTIVLFLFTGVDRIPYAARGFGWKYIHTTIMEINEVTESCQVR